MALLKKEKKLYRIVLQMYDKKCYRGIFAIECVIFEKISAKISRATSLFFPGITGNGRAAFFK